MTIKQNNIKFRDDTYSTSSVVKLWNNSEGRTWMLFDFRDLWKKKFPISWKKNCSLFIIIHKIFEDKKNK